MADGVEQAVMRLLREPIDLLVADLMMPGLDGLDLMTILQARDAWRDLPVVIVSAMSDLKQIETLNGLGIRDYIVKPFNPTIAIPRLKKIMASLPTDRQRQWTEPIQLEEGRIPILLACARPEVADAVRSAVEPPYDVSVVDSGPSAVIKALEIHPWVVFLAGDLGTWDSGKTLRSLVALKTLEGIRVISLPHPDRGARVITEAVLRDLSPAPFAVASAGKSTTATLEGTFRASCLGALRVALSGAISPETERVVFELPSEGIGKHLFPLLQEMALLSKLEV
jgi:CheY-like chemotaxis protein